MARQIDKILGVVDRLARNLKPNEYITNKGLKTELCNQYPEFEGHRNPIEAADFSANNISGYNVRQLDGSFKRSRNPILFRSAYNCYIRYEPQIHGPWECRIINGKKTVIRKN